jgi:hypothetical protein
MYYAMLTYILCYLYARFIDVIFGVWMTWLVVCKVALVGCVDSFGVVVYRRAS